MQKYWPEDLQIVAESWKNVYENYKLLDWLCGVSCTNMDQKALKLQPKVGKTYTKITCF